MLVLLVLGLAAPARGEHAKKETGNLTGVLLPYVPPKPGELALPGETGNESNPLPESTAKRPGANTPPQRGSKKGKKEKASPISITALRMEADNKEGWVLFIGKVKAVQKDMVLTSDRLKVYLDSKGKVKRVVATGGVRVEQAGRVITSSQAEYDPLKETVVFTGNPKAWQGKNVVMGKRIVYFVKEKRSTVEGGKGKVSAVLFPKEKKGGK